MDKPCTFCGNNGFRQARVQYVYEHEVYALIVDDVPCEQCEYCNENYFTEESAKIIQDAFINKYFKVKRKKKP